MRFQHLIPAQPRQTRGCRLFGAMMTRMWLDHVAAIFNMLLRERLSALGSYYGHAVHYTICAVLPRADDAIGVPTGYLPRFRQPSPVTTQGYNIIHDICGCNHPTNTQSTSCKNPSGPNWVTRCQTQVLNLLCIPTLAPQHCQYVRMHHTCECLPI